jgi:hypothetical protein
MNSSEDESLQPKTQKPHLDYAGRIPIICFTPKAQLPLCEMQDMEAYRANRHTALNSQSSAASECSIRRKEPSDHVGWKTS